MKKIFSIYIAIIALFLSAFSASASTDLNAYFFYGDGCPHCAKESKLLDELAYKHPDLKIKRFEIYHNKENALMLKEVGHILNENISGVPFLVVGGKAFAGYADGITSNEVENVIRKCANGGCDDPVSFLANAGSYERDSKAVGETAHTSEEKISKKEMDLPFLGNVDIANFSLPLLTVSLGLLDGFNPCAMWTLLFLISLLLGMENRKRMWILGVAFIVASALVYFMFMSAWLNLIMFLGLIASVRILIGGLALFGGSYNLREFVVNKSSGCKVTNKESRQKVFVRLKSIVNENSFWIAFAGIIALAFMVNLVELVCSAGLPAVYTQVLAMNDLSGLHYYAYISLYIFFFMIDDLFIFFIAMITLEMTGISTKYSRYSQLIGGSVMVIIGLLLIFKHQWLMFG